MITITIECEGCGERLVEACENSFGDAFSVLDNSQSDYLYQNDDDEFMIYCKQCQADDKERNPNEDDDQYKIAKGL